MFTPQWAWVVCAFQVQAFQSLKWDCTDSDSRFFVVFLDGAIMKKIRTLLVFLMVLMVIGTMVKKFFFNETGTITDTRDGQVYKTIKIGDQEWMAENLNYDYNAGSARSYCYEDKPENCQKYGRLYTWSAAMDSAALFSTNGQGCGIGNDCSMTEAVQGVCPEGWVLPTIKDWANLFKTAGGLAEAGKKLKSTNGWNNNGNSTDELSFGALPAGNEYCNNTHEYYNEGNLAFFWSSTEFDQYSAFQMYLDYGSAWLESRFPKSCGYSVRCLKKTSSDNSKIYSASSSGSMTDSRDGKTYKTVKIGDQIWMAENLNYDYNVGSAKSYCYLHHKESCERYGRLYTWAAAMDSAAIFSNSGKGCGFNSEGCEILHPHVQGVCPDGWHIPTNAEIKILHIEASHSPAGMKSILSTSGWNDGGNGLDAFSFTLLPAGLWVNQFKAFSQEGDVSYLWTSDSYNGWERNGRTAIFYWFSYTQGAFANLDKRDGFSVRCIKDN